MIELNTIIFIILSLLICLRNNAVHALLSLILVFINFAMLLFYLDIVFLVFFFILIYVIFLLHICLFTVLNKTNLFSLLECVSFTNNDDLPSFPKNLYKNKGLIITILLVLILFSVYILRSPLLLIMFLALCGLMQILSLFPLFHQRINFLFLIFIKFLLKTHLLSFSFFIYNYFHHTLTLRQFKIVSIFIGFICFFQLVLCRYIFYLRIEHMDVPFYLLFLFVIGFLTFSLRSYITFSFFIIPYTFNNFRDIGNLLLTTPEIPEVQHTSTSIKFGGMFNTHKHNHYYPPEIPKSFFYRNVGITIAVAGIGLTCYACYQYKISADAAVRSADAAEVSAGLMTKDEFNSRWKKR